MDNKDKKLVEPEIITEVGGVEKVNKNAIATIHNNLIQARHKLSLEEIRLMDTIISFIQPEDNDFKVYKIPVSIFKDLYGKHRKDVYDVAKRTIEGLLSKPIKVESVNKKGKKVFEMFNFISYGKYEEGAGNFYISISPQFKPYLLQLKEFFTKIPIKYTYILRSRYAIRLYELLKQYENTGFRVDYLTDLKEILGIEPEEYPRFDNFERRVLKTAVKEINDKTDMQVSYKKKKTGRKITHIEFTIKPKSKTNNINNENLTMEEVKSLNQGVTTQTTKSPSQTIDIQGQEQIIFEKVDNVKSQCENNSMNVWEEIGKIRRKHRRLLDEILKKVNRLNENQILFLFVNVNENQFPKEILKEMIISIDNNKSINNPMGFLIKTLNIDTKQAKFKELILIFSKIDEDLFREKLKSIFVEGKSAIEYFRVYWDEVIKPKYAEGLINKNTMKILKYPLRLAVYDEFDNIIYVPAPDMMYKEWLEDRFLEDLRKFLKEKFNIDNIVVEIVDIEEFQNEDF